MPPQLKGLLPLFSVFEFLFLLVRYFLVPESFGEHTHYRPNSLEDIPNEIYYNNILSIIKINS